MQCERVDDRTDAFDELDEEDEPLGCLDCNVNFTHKEYLYNHLLYHIKQPFVKLDRVQESNPPLKITLKNRSGNSFEIVSPVTSPLSSEPGCGSNSLDEETAVEGHNNEQASVTYEIKPFDSEEEEEDHLDDEFHEEASELDDEQHNEGHTSDFDSFDSLGGNQGSTHSSETDYERATVNFSPNLAEVIGGAFLADIDSPIPFEGPSTEAQPQESPREADTAEGDKSDKDSGNSSDNTAGIATLANGSHANSPPYGSIPGAEPTPPPEPSPTGATEYPKIKIRSTGLFKDPEPRGCTITEITDDNPTGDPSMNHFFPGNNHPTPIWTTPSLDDPLKLPESDNLMTLLNSNDRNNKDLGYSSSSDNEFISLDTFNERNRGSTNNNANAMQLYNPNNVPASSSQLESITGLPMQALAQQVSRLNPNNGQGLHQQNVLINIQQFPQQPQQPYPPQPPQHQPMYPPHYPPHPGQPPMHQPYPYQPPNPMYPHYPPAPGYPPASHMPPPPPQHQMGQMQPPQMGQQPGKMGGPGQPPNSMPVPSSQGQNMPPPNQMPQPPNNMQGGYRPPMPPGNRALAPRGPHPGGSRMPGGPRAPMGNRAPGTRPRAPMIRARGGAPPIRGQMRPRMAGPQGGIRPGVNQTSPLKRNPDPNSIAMAKRKKVDVLTPSDKDDDDCQVICMQPKNTGLPQIESIQGASESIMKLPDSITLSVRNPPKVAVSPQKSEAKAVANVLASRGITVTASKPKEAPTKQVPAIPAALSLNGAVSIVAKNAGSPAKPAASDALPTVDLTDDSPNNANSNNRPNRAGLPYRCDLCPAQYPNAMGLNKHRQTYHKTTSGMCELGVPLINIKQPGIMQRLSQLGINNYIPLPSAGPEGTYAMPIISTKNPGNVAALGATQMLSLGPVRTIPKPGANNVNANSPIKK